MSIRRSDGAFFASKMGNGAQSTTPNFRGQRVVSGPQGVRHVAGDNYIDGKARIVAWYTTASYPVMLLVGTSDAALQQAYSRLPRDLGEHAERQPGAAGPRRSRRAAHRAAGRAEAIHPRSP